MPAKNLLSKNIEFVSRSDQGGRGDGCQVMVHRGYAYIGHLFSNGFTILDVRDPRKPRTVGFIPAPPQTWSLHVQTHEDLLFVVNALDMYNLPIFFEEAEYHSKSVIETLSESGYTFTAGLRIFDISNPEVPREIGFMPVDGFGLHRMWYVGGRYAYVSAHVRGYTDYVLLIIDVSDPTEPHEVGRYWLPGMWVAGGEKPTWPQGRRFSAHHAIVAGDTAYASWRDGGMTLLDISDKTQPRLIAHRNWSPPFGGGTHTTLPLPDRDLVIVADESIADNCADGIKYVWVVDVREPTNPVTIATFPLPEEDDYCRQPGHFGPHNLHEMRPGSFQSSDIIFVTLQNAGVRAYDIREPFQPREIAYFVPPPPETIVDPRPRPVGVNTTDVYVDPDGLMYVTDYNAGLYIWNLRERDPFAGTTLTEKVCRTAGVRASDSARPRIFCVTITTLTTVGGGKPSPMSVAGKCWTMAVDGYVLERQFVIAVKTRRMRHDVARVRDHFVLCGYGRVGSEIAHELTDDNSVRPHRRKRALLAYFSGEPGLPIPKRATRVCGDRPICSSQRRRNSR